VFVTYCHGILDTSLMHVYDDRND